jgi:hypothetical protein
MYPPFEIDDKISIQELLGYAHDDDDEDDSVAPATSTDAVVEGFNRAAEEVRDIPNSLASATLKEALAAAEEKNAATLADYEDALDTMPSPPFQRTSPNEIRGDPSQITPAKMYAMNLTGTDLALFMGNTQTKYEVVKALMEQEREGWRLFRQMADNKFALWDGQIKQLEGYAEMLGSKRLEAAAIAEKAREVHERIAKLEEATEGVRQYRFTSELQGTPQVPSYLSGRYVQSPNQGQYPMYQMPMQGNTYAYTISRLRTNF